MTDHEKLRSLVDDFVDGTLAHDELRKFEAHLKTCSECATEVVQTRSLVTQAAQLSRETAPERDLWPELESRLEPAAIALKDKPAGLAGWFQTWGLGQGLAAAATVAVVVLGVFVLTSRQGTTVTGTGAPVAELPATDVPSITVFDESGRTQSSTFAQMIWGLEKESMGAEKALVAAIQTGSSSLDFEGAQAIDQSLRVLDQAIADAADALRTDPENAVLVKRVTGYYRQRLSLLQKATLLASQNMT